LPTDVTDLAALVVMATKHADKMADRGKETR
jgi:hypothetical protein